MAANCALYPHNWAVWGGFNKINKLTGRPPPAPEARGGQSLTKDQFVIAPPGAGPPARARARAPTSRTGPDSDSTHEYTRKACHS